MILVVEADVRPDDSEALVNLFEELPSRVEYGDTFDISMIKTFGASPEVLTVTWRFEDDVELTKTERRLFEG